jgi:hypothetical protein
MDLQMAGIVDQENVRESIAANCSPLAMMPRSSIAGLERDAARFALAAAASLKSCVRFAPLSRRPLRGLHSMPLIR